MRNRKMWVRAKGEIEAFTAYAPLGANPITIAMTEYRLDGDTLIVCFCPDATAIDPDDKDAVQDALRAYVPTSRSWTPTGTTGQTTNSRRAPG